MAELQEIAQLAGTRRNPRPYHSMFGYTPSRVASEVLGGDRPVSFRLSDGAVANPRIPISNGGLVPGGTLHRSQSDILSGGRPTASPRTKFDRLEANFQRTIFDRMVQHSATVLFKTQEESRKQAQRWVAVAS